MAAKNHLYSTLETTVLYTWPWDRSWLLLTPCVFVYCFKLWPASHLSRQKCTRRILLRPSPGMTLLKIKGLHTAWKICYSFIYNIIGKRLDHGRLHPKLEVSGVTCLSWKSNLGLHGGKEPFKQLVNSYSEHLPYERATSVEWSQHGSPSACVTWTYNTQELH